MESDNRRIAKNTLMLYIRMLFSMAVSLYTSRVVLNTLGVEDYGIYNVVGGVVSMLGFLNGAMATSTQRYLTFELGRGDNDRLKDVFMTSIYSHILISLVVVVIMETVGLWFLYNKMIIPGSRIDAAFWVFQFSIATTVIGIMSTPYNAIIIAHEQMGAFAYISILEVTLKLGVVFLLYLGDMDRLILYAILLFVVQLFIRFIYSIYCVRHFEESHFRWRVDASLFREMTVFAGWNVWGNLAGAFMTQGLNLLLNAFFGPIVNAARGIAVQVQAAVSMFSVNFQTALNPQITKTYAKGAIAEMHLLIFRSSKFTFFLLLILALPVMMETDWILKIWLSTVPEYTATFIRIMLCSSIVSAVANPFMTSAAATGKVKIYQSVVGGLLLLILPIAYIVLKAGGNPSSVFVTELCVCSVAFVVRMFIVRPLIGLSIRQYFSQVMLRCISVAILAAAIPIAIKILCPDTLGMAAVNCAVSIVSAALAAYCLGLTENERYSINSKVKSIIAKIR